MIKKIMKFVRDTYSKIMFYLRQSHQQFNVIFWVLMLMGIYKPYFNRYTGIYGIEAMVIMFVMSVLILTIIGVLYVVNIKGRAKDLETDLLRNPYATHLFSPKETEVEKRNLLVIKSLKKIAEEMKGKEEIVKDLEKAEKTTRKWIKTNRTN